MSTVLVVDDEYVISDILELALEDAGYQVEKASNGLRALEVLDKTRVELLITDYMMPVMNGEELARKLRDDPQFRALPIILMSGAQASIGRENPGLFDGVLDKPFDTEMLIAMVQRLVPPPGD
ncbi:response regulator [Pseudomonas japonica]|uniref:Response regulator receiver domain-containing protein n=1 Tax=Pseudomonas japonica TaxID=256466 RepID=A0A239EUN4_9PSED|nr:response regulator [Pseudomonas japonica]SNS48307.1 Response regulator receiver domain-containing protein [Pseudomonas japonica]